MLFSLTTQILHKDIPTEVTISHTDSLCPDSFYVRLAEIINLFILIM